MFVLVEDTSIIAGPVDWKPGFFQRILMQDYGVDAELPLATPSNQVIKITDLIRILPVTDFNRPYYDSLRQDLAGPYWNFFEDRAEGYYTVVDRPFEHVKNTFKDRVPASRYVRETAGFVYNLQGTNVWISTARDQRTAYTNGVPGLWKFKSVISAPQMKIVNGLPQEITVSGPGGDIWITVTNEDLQSITDSIKQHVQAAFDWEQSIIAIIDSTTTFEELVALEI